VRWQANGEQAMSFGSPFAPSLATQEQNSSCWYSRKGINPVLRYSAKRVSSSLIVVVLISVFAFALVRLAPGDAALVMLGEESTPEAVAKLREYLGLDRPLILQYFTWAKQVFRGDLGVSVYMETTVAEVVVTKFPVTLAIAVATVLIAAGVGIPLGIIAAVKRLTWIDQAISTVSIMGLSVPSFWLGLNLMLVFAVWLRWFPTGGCVPASEGFFPFLKSIFLPSFALGIKWSALVVRMTRSCMLEILGRDFMQTARAKGLRESVVVLKHGFRNAVIPIVTVLGLVFGLALGGAIIIETVFSIPGIGRLLVFSIARRDYSVVQGIILIIGLNFTAVNLLVDLTYGMIDPRIKYE